MKTNSTAVLVFVAALLAAASSLLALGGLPSSLSPALARHGLPSAAGDWPTYGHDTARTGHNPAETLISMATVPNLVSRWQVFIGADGAPAFSDLNNGSLLANLYVVPEGEAGAGIWNSA